MLKLVTNNLYVAVINTLCSFAINYPTFLFCGTIILTLLVYGLTWSIGGRQGWKKLKEVLNNFGSGITVGTDNDATRKPDSNNNRRKSDATNNAAAAAANTTNAATSINITHFGERKPTIPDPGRFDPKTMDIDVFFGLYEAYLRQ